MFDSKFHGHQSTKLQLSYETMFGYVQKLQRSRLVPLKTINIVSYNKFFKPRPGRARQVFRLDRIRRRQLLIITITCHVGLLHSNRNW